VSLCCRHMRDRTVGAGWIFWRLQYLVKTAS
jgi:hypothetical protein